MLILFAAIAFMFGATIASALNCAVYRQRRGMDWVHGHSECEACGSRLSWMELVPVFSSLALHGKCAHCGAYIGYTHLISEISVGSLAAMTVCAYSYSSWLALALAIIGVVFAIAFALSSAKGEQNE